MLLPNPARRLTFILMCLASVCSYLLLTSCSVAASGSYKPPFLPLKFVIDTQGQVSLQADTTVSTTIGDFGVGAAAESNLTPPDGGLLVFIQRLVSGQPMDAGFRVNEDAEEKIVVIDNDITLKITGRILSIDAKWHHDVLITTPQAQNGFYDSLKDAPNSGWDDSQTCSAQSDGYHVSDSDPQLTTGCGVPFEAIADASISVTVRQVSGPTDSGYGIEFRSSYTPQFKYCQCYSFVIASNGEWTAYKDVRDDYSDIVPWESSSAIHTGLNAANTLAVDAHDRHFVFFINGTKVGEADDSSLISGVTYLEVASGQECVFTDFLIAM